MEEDTWHVPEWRHVIEPCDDSDTESLRNSWQFEHTPRLEMPFIELQTTHEVTDWAAGRTCNSRHVNTRQM